ncbi:aspartic proteinase CDR1-like [Euphorbia lathyris]|uniref:aspartic proteinase CDR1-like n=1 Tax=Euphorbia lathyris TaxID=212925 RepID=UPI0033137A7F
MSHLFTLSIFTLHVIILLSSSYAKFTQPDTFTAELIHRNSPNSPFFNASETSTDRLSNALKRSANRGIQSTLSPGDGNYVMKIGIGTPPTPLLVSIASATNILWIPCQKCAPHSSSCTQKMFNSMASSTYRNVPCNSQHFCSNSCYSSNDVCLHNCTENCPTGTLGLETITLTSSTGRSFRVPEVNFVCGNHVGKNFAGVGIAGLGQGPVSLTSRLYNFINGKFSYCLVPYNSKKTSKITFGDLSFDASSSEVISLPLGQDSQDKNTGNYYIPLLSIRSESYELWRGLRGLRGPRLSEQSGNFLSSGNKFNMLIDTETLFTRIPREEFHYFATYVSYDISQDPSVEFFDKGVKLEYCYRYREEEFKAKKIRMVFDIDLDNSRSIELGISNSFIRVSKDVICLAFEASSDDSFVLGSWQMMNYLVGFDLKQHTVYFQKTDCSNY